MAVSVADVFGWKAVYYSLGASTLVFWAIWTTQLSEDPDSFHGEMAADEKKYIRLRCSFVPEKKPSKSSGKCPQIRCPMHLITSLPAWVPVFCHIVHKFVICIH